MNVRNKTTVVIIHRLFMILQSAWTYDSQTEMALQGKQRCQETKVQETKVQETKVQETKVQETKVSGTIVVSGRLQNRQLLE